MVLRPATLDELSAQLAEASRGGNEVSSVELSGLNRLVEHQPEDMTATVQSGMPLGELQRALRASNQWLPIDPAHPENFTVADVLAQNLSGPRRFGYGTIRDYLIGIRVALAHGRVVNAGGKVVKNVAGYDLCKLFVGAKHSLGIIVEGTFKLRPVPEAEVILQRTFSDLDELTKCARGLLESDLAPVILDAWSEGAGFNLVAGFAGAREDVLWQAEQTRRVGLTEETNTGYDARFREKYPHAGKVSVLPTDTTRQLQNLNGAPFVARFGNGIIASPALARPSPEVPNPKLQQRLKEAFDPLHILPGYLP